MGNRLLAVSACVLMLVVGLLGAAILHLTAPIIATLSAIGGIVLGAVCLIVISSRESRGKFSVDLKEKRSDIEWTVRQEEPLDTIFPTTPSNTTNSYEAIRLCEEGRALLNGGGDIADAYGLFERAIALDSNYWEPKANMAGIQLIRGQLKEAYDLANEVKNAAFLLNNDLALANASLTMASAIETSIDPQAPADQKKGEYSKILALLDQALQRSPEDAVLRSAKIKAQIIAGSPREEIISELRTGFEHGDFLTEFSTVLRRDDELRDAFCKECPEIADVIFRRGTERN